MASKPKGFGKPLHQKQSEESLQKDLERLSKRLVREDVTGTFAETVIAPRGAVKMSEVLEDFVEPYLESAENHQQREQLFGLAMTAWNLALLPEPERQVILDRTFERLISPTGLLKEYFDEIIGELIARKLDYFTDNRRLIVSFELKDTGRDFQLLVASTLEKTP
jgi:hypothetical protein